MATRRGFWITQCYHWYDYNIASEGEQLHNYHVFSAGFFIFFTASKYMYVVDI